MVRLSLTPDRSSYRPGDVLRASLEVWNDAPGAIDLAGVTIFFAGLERVDHTWVTQSYAANIPPVERDGRRDVRHLFQTAPVHLAKETMLLPGQRRQWSCKFQLPDSLPPTFKGVAVRYAYHFHVSARYHDPVGATPSAAAAAAVEAAALDGRRSSPTASERSLASLASHRTAPPSRTPSGHMDASSRAPSLSSFLFRGVLGGSPADKPLAPAETYAWQEVTLRVPIHIWPPRDPGQRVLGVVAGKDAEMSTIMYELEAPRPLPSQREGERPEPLSPSLSQLHCQEVGRCDSLSADMSEVNSTTLGAGSVPSWVPALVGKASGSEGGALGMGGLGGTGQSSWISSRPSSPRSIGSLRDEDGAMGVFVRRGPGGSPRGPTSNGDQWGPDSTPRATVKASGSPRTLAEKDKDKDSLRSYNLHVGSNTLVRLALHGPLDGSVELGSTLAGTLDFRAGHAGRSDSRSPSGASPDGRPRCIQLVISLETEEAIQEGFAMAPERREAAGVIRKVYDEHPEVTQDVLLSHFMFSVPYDAPPSFSTSLVKLTWLLRFEFTIFSNRPASGWLSSSGPDIPEHITWTLPFIVRAPCK